MLCIVLLMMTSCHGQVSDSDFGSDDTFDTTSGDSDTWSADVDWHHLDGSSRPSPRRQLSIHENLVCSLFVGVVIGAYVMYILLQLKRRQDHDLLPTHIQRRPARPARPARVAARPAQDWVDSRSQGGRAAWTTHLIWSGHYVQDRRRRNPCRHSQHIMTLDIAAWDAQSGRVNGCGEDDIGRFTVDGRFSVEEGHVEFVKTYDSSAQASVPVTYQGTFDVWTRGLKGKWYLPNGSCGSFELVPDTCCKLV